MEEIIKSEYEQLKASGMFWEFFPELSGEWERDQSPYTKFYQERERRKNGEVDQSVK
jgi:hypothetical protein